MRKILISIFLSLAIFCTQAFAYSTPNDTIVYITDYGDCYHRSNCRYLRESRHKTTIGEAVSKGYAACSICSPGGSGGTFYLFPEESDSDETPSTDEASIGPDSTQVSEEPEPSQNKKKEYGEWIDSGYGLLYNTWTDQVKTEDGNIYNNEADALEDMGYSYDSEYDMWIGEEGIIQDGEFSPYQELDGGEPEEEPIQEDDGDVPVELSTTAEMKPKPISVSGIAALCFCLCIFVVIPLITFVAQIVKDIQYQAEQKKKNK